MLNFEFYNPTKILFGNGQIAKISKEIPDSKNIMLLYGGGSIKQNGIYEQVTSALSNHNLVEFHGIEPNPEYNTLMKAVKQIKEKSIDFLLAVGGGSVIDGTKFIAAAALHEGKDTWDILHKRIRIEKALPFGTVLTLPATGSEMNSGAVITRSETKEKLGMGGPGLFPLFSVLDPLVIKSLPQRQIANGVTDAFTHVLEQYLTYPVNAWLQDRIAESILLTLIETAPKILHKPEDYTAASNFMWCCTMALNGLIQKGVPTDWATHMIGHELTAYFGIDHARTLAIIGPNLYQYKFAQKKEKLAQYGERVWGITQGSIEEKASKAIEKTRTFFHSIDIKTKLSAYTDTYQGIALQIAQRFEERGWKGLGEHRDITPNDVRAIVEMSY
jgi:NADP-dependent alcohol dehydrogenase